MLSTTGSPSNNAQDKYKMFITSKFGFWLSFWPGANIKLETGLVQVFFVVQSVDVVGGEHTSGGQHSCANREPQCRQSRDADLCQRGHDDNNIRA